MPEERCGRRLGQNNIFVSFTGLMAFLSDSKDEFRGFMVPITVTFRADVHYVVIFMTSLYVIYF